MSFMGYSPSGRGYRLCSLAMNHFFDSGNVIFDENIPYHTLHEISSTPVDYSKLPFSAAIYDTITPASSDQPGITDPGPDTHGGTSSDQVLSLSPSGGLPESFATGPVLRTNWKLTGVGHSY